MPTPLHLVTASDAGYFQGLEVLVATTVLHVPVETEIHFHIFDGGIPATGWESLRQLAGRFHPRTFIHPLSFADERFASFPGLHGNKLVYARLLIADVLPTLDKVIYIDADIIVGRNLEELRDTDLRGRTALACGDSVVPSLDKDCPWLPEAETSGYRYFNAGLLVLDLALWRKRNYLEQCVAAISLFPTKCRFWDQTALNYVLRDDVTYAPTHWNQVVFNSVAVPDDVPIVIHLIADKPWRDPFPRFDHYLWIACYADLIGRPHTVPKKLSLGRRVFAFLPRYRATRWLFWMIFGAAAALSTNPDTRIRRAQTLYWAMSDFAVLDRLRREWRRLAASRRK